jgi:hypothetical protein
MRGTGWSLSQNSFITKDNLEGRMIGTSFGGFGAKVFTVLPLPREDTVKLLRLLYALQHEGDATPPASVPS